MSIESPSVGKLRAVLAYVQGEVKRFLGPTAAVPGLDEHDHGKLVTAKELEPYTDDATAETNLSPDATEFLSGLAVPGASTAEPKHA